jgi:hypothetical protein
MKDVLSSSKFWQAVMEIDPDRIDEAVLALLFLGRHEKVRTWKVLRLGRHGAVACKGAYLRPGWEGKISGLHRARFAAV